MPRFRTRLALSGLLPALAALLLSSCVDTTLSYVSPDFHPDLLVTRGVAVGSIQDGGGRAPFLTNHDAQMLQGELVSRLAHSKKISYLTPVSGNRRPYQLTVEVTSNETESWVSEDVSTTEETIYNDEGKPCGCITKTTYTTSAHTRRSVAADFRLVDPSTGKLAWAWSGEHDNCNTYSNCSEFGFPPPPHYPQAPATKNVADDLVRVAVKRMRKVK